jgi:hypothetical protein
MLARLFYCLSGEPAYFHDWDGDEQAPAPLKSNRKRCWLDFDAPVTRPYFDGHPGHESSLLPQFLRDDDTPASINGCLHGTKRTTSIGMAVLPYTPL